MELVFGVNYKTRQQIDNMGRVIGAIVTGEPIEDSILLTREQFNELRAKIAGDAWNASFEHECGAFGLGVGEAPNKEQYLSSLNSKEK